MLLLCYMLFNKCKVSGLMVLKLQSKWHIMIYETLHDVLTINKAVSYDKTFVWTCRKCIIYTAFQNCHFKGISLWKTCDAQMMSTPSSSCCFHSHAVLHWTLYLFPLWRVLIILCVKSISMNSSRRPMWTFCLWCFANILWVLIAAAQLSELSRLLVSEMKTSLVVVRVTLAYLRSLSSWITW